MADLRQENELLQDGIGNDGAINLAKEWLGKESCGVSWLSLTSNGIGPEGAKHKTGHRKAL